VHGLEKHERPAYRYIFECSETGKAPSTLEVSPKGDNPLVRMEAISNKSIPPISARRSIWTITINRSKL
jgi:hypothetical protein